MTKKVLIVDDSALMRRVMSDIIVEDEQLTVADTAKNGKNAIEHPVRNSNSVLAVLPANTETYRSPFTVSSVSPCTNGM